MKLVMVSIRDIVADAWQPPACVQSLGHAVRGFTDEVNRPAEDNLLYKHAEDFELYHLGFFDLDSGGVELLDNRKSLCLGREVMVRASGEAQPSLPLRSVR